MPLLSWSCASERRQCTKIHANFQWFLCHQLPIKQQKRQHLRPVLGIYCTVAETFNAKMFTLPWCWEFLRASGLGLMLISNCLQASGNPNKQLCPGSCPSPMQKFVVIGAILIQNLKELVSNWHKNHSGLHQSSAIIAATRGMNRGELREPLGGIQGK